MQQLGSLGTPEALSLLQAKLTQPLTPTNQTMPDTEMMIGFLRQNGKTVTRKFQGEKEIFHVE
jgi:hypothetical protein